MMDIMLRLLVSVLLFCVVQPIDGENAAASCGNFMQDWYPGVEPRSSVAPYALNVSDENGDFSRGSWRTPTYGSKTVQTGSCDVGCCVWDLISSVGKIYASKLAPVITG